MEEPYGLQEWELLSDSDSSSHIAFEEIIHADYFSLDSTKLHTKDQGMFLSTNEQLGIEEIDFLDENFVGFQPKNETFDHVCQSDIGDSTKGGSFLGDGSKMEVGIEGSELKDQNCYVVDSERELDITEVNKGGSCLVNHSNMQVDIEETANGDSFHGDVSNTDLGLEESGIRNEKTYAIDCNNREIEKDDSLLVDDSKREVNIQGITKEVSLKGVDSKTVLGSEGTELVHEDPYAVELECKHKLALNEIPERDSMLVDDSKEEEGIEEIDATNQNYQELVSVSSIETSNSNGVSVHDGEKKVKIWWKLPLDVIKLFTSRVKPVWSISIAAAFIGILMVARKLYQMKHKSRRIPLKISFEDKKAASQLLLRAAHLNEIIVRRVPVIRSPLLPAGGMTPWSVGGQL